MGVPSILQSISWSPFTRRMGLDLVPRLRTWGIELSHFWVNKATRERMSLRRDFFESFENMVRSQVW
jgi:hypothetical protein